MEKYCKSCGRVFDDLKLKLCPFCSGELDFRYEHRTIPRELRHKVFKRDGYRCCECGANKDETSLEIDYIIPIAKGGTNDMYNLQTLCHECNSMKHNYTWIYGETDSYQIKNQIKLKTNERLRLEKKVTTLHSENEIINCKHNIIKLNEEINLLQEKLITARNYENENLEFQNKIQEYEQEYKISVSLSDDEIDEWLKEYKDYHYSTKEQVENFFVDVSSPKFALGMRYYYNQQLTIALKIFDNLVEFSKSEEVWVQKGLCHYYLNQMDEAFSAFDKALMINPLNVALLFFIAVRHSELNNYQDILTYSDKILEIDPNYPDAWALKSKAHIGLANLSNNMNERKSLLTEALIFLENDPAWNPENNDYWFLKARILEELGEYEEELNCYNECIKLNPNDAEAWNRKGIYFLNQENYEDALNCLDKAIKIDNNAIYWENKGKTLEDNILSDIEKTGFCINKETVIQAIECYEKALELDHSMTHLENQIQNLDNYLAGRG